MWALPTLSAPNFTSYSIRSPAPNGTFARFVVDAATVVVAGVDWAAEVVAAAAIRTARRVKTDMRLTMDARLVPDSRAKEALVTPRLLLEQRAASLATEADE